MSISVQQAVHDIRLLTDLNVASISVLVYDYLLTVGDEIELVWSSKWNVGKILYFVIRYSVIFDILLVKTANLAALSEWWCQILLYAEEWFFTFGVGMVAVMLALRTWIIWNRDREIGWVMCALLGLLRAVMLVIGGLNDRAGTGFC